VPVARPLPVRVALFLGNLVRHRRGVRAVAGRSLRQRLGPLVSLSWAEAKGIGAVRARRVDLVRSLADSTEEERGLAYDVISRDVDLLGFERDGFRWLAFPHDGLSRELFTLGAYQPGEIEAVLQWLAGRGDRTTIVEVGANIGTTTLPLMRAGWRVLAIEPVPTTVEVLRLNIERNGFEPMVDVVPVGVSRAAGTVTMALNGDFGQSEIVEPGTTPGFGVDAIVDTVEVTCLPLEQIVIDAGLAPERVALVWSDTQGHETTIIETGRSLWTAGAALYVEVWPRGLRAHGGTEAFLAGAEASFATFLTREDLLATGPSAPRRPIAELTDVVASLPKNKYTDALLFPAGV
jgi:FkbM family methyltransferase